jgi:hypothetical protein
MAGLQATDRPSSVQAALLTDEDGHPATRCGTFSVGCVLFQVVCCEQGNSDHATQVGTWLSARGLANRRAIPIQPGPDRARQLRSSLKYSQLMICRLWQDGSGTAFAPDRGQGCRRRVTSERWCSPAVRITGGMFLVALLG